MINDSQWRWCLTATISKEHLPEEDYPFAPGIKVYVLPDMQDASSQKMIAIGLPRYSRSYTEAVIDASDLGSFELEKVENPFVLLVMNASAHFWWDDTEESKEKILAFLDSVNITATEENPEDSGSNLHLRKFDVIEAVDMDEICAIDLTDAGDVIEETEIINIDDSFDKGALDVQEDLMSTLEEA